MKTFYLLIAATLGVLLAQPAQSQELPLCYLVTTTGQIVDLNNLCHQTDVKQNKEQIFQQLLQQSATSSDQEYLQSHGGLAQAKYLAQRLCTYYGQGLSPTQAFQALDEDMVVESNSPQVQSLLTLLNTVGTQVYCPN